MKVTEKAWSIDFSNIDEGYLYDQSGYICYTENRNKARSILLSEYRWEMVTYWNEELTYLNIPVKRAKEFDKYDVDGLSLTSREIEKIKYEKEREDELNSTLTDERITHCYIKKRGAYYRPNSCGYTDFNFRAGIYEKSEAVRMAKSCEELDIIPIDTEEHNKMIEDEISELKDRLI